MAVYIQSQDYRDLLDTVDQLRALGVSQHVALPEIVVCGNQSAGKSSILEAISGLSFPAGDNLCTRFATEIVLRRQPCRSMSIAIVPHHSRTDAEKARLAAFTATVDPDHPDLGPVIEAAKAAMGLSGDDAAAGTHSRRFSSDVLRIELSGPEQQHLTLVDLPGLFRAGNSQPSEDEAAAVRRLVKSYMKRPHSLVLAVVSAGNDFAIQEVTQLARSLDRRGRRTMGLITKPDQLDHGTDSEQAFVRLAQNKDVPLQLGWHVLKNRSYEMREATSAERDADELAFFQTGAWAAVHPASLGVGTLRPRLSSVLKNQILAQLPAMLRDIDYLLADCDSRLQQLGEPRGTLGEQRVHLTRLSSAFVGLVRQATDGTYADRSFFAGSDVYEGSDKYQGRRLRAVIQSLLMDFGKTMRLRGHSLTISDSQPTAGHTINRRDYIVRVTAMAAKHRGRELPGMYNPMVVGELFRQQCQRWPGLAKKCADNAMQSCLETVLAVLGHTTVPDVGDKILQTCINPGMEQLKTALYNMVVALLAPHRDGHPITYNHYLTENVQRIQHARLRAELGSTIRQEHISPGQNRDYLDLVSIEGLLNTIMPVIEPDMQRKASTDAIDFMEAYYKLALKKIIDDISVLAIEQCLVSKLCTLFTPKTVAAMSDKEIAHLAGEADEVVAERQHLTERRAMLEKGQIELRRLDRHRPQMAMGDRDNKESSGEESSCEEGDSSEEECPLIIRTCLMQKTVNLRELIIEP